MSGRKDLARMQAELDKIVRAGSTRPPRQKAAEPRLAELPLDLLRSRLGALHAELAALSALKPQTSNHGVDEPSESSDVPRTAVDSQPPEVNEEDVKGGGAAADDTGAAHGGYVVDLTVADSRRNGGAGPANSARAAHPPRRHKTGPGTGVRRTVHRLARAALWPAFVPAALREQETLELPPMYVAAVGSDADLHAKLCLTAYQCTHADVALALLGSGEFQRGGDAGTPGRGGSDYDVALRAMKDAEVLAGDGDEHRELLRTKALAVHDVRRRLEAGMREAALDFEVAVTDAATHGAMRRAFVRRSPTAQSKLSPSPGLEHLVTFERLVLGDDGRALRLGPGSLLRCLAGGLVSRTTRPELLVMPGGAELRVTPALLAGLLVEAEDMCTPANASFNLDTRGVRVRRTRALFDTYVRPLTQLPDGGGVLLPQAHVEAWLQGLGWLPMAFRVPIELFPHCLFPPNVRLPVPSSVKDTRVRERGAAAARPQEPATSDAGALAQASSDDGADGDYTPGASREASPSLLTQGAGDARAARSDDDVDSGDESSGASWSSAPSLALSRHAAPLQAESAVDEAKLFLLTYSATRADVILALVASGALPGLRKKYKGTGGPQCSIEDCLKAVRNVSEVSRQEAAARPLVAKVKEATHDATRAAANRLYSAALHFRVSSASTVLSESDPTTGRPAFLRVQGNAKGGSLYPHPKAAKRGLVTFERLVLRPGGGLQLGEGSLMHCLTAACLRGHPQRALLLTDGGRRFRYTPALLAGLLVEAEDMCAPVEHKQAFEIVGRRTLRMRHMFDAYVRPLTQLSDGGGVLLSRVRVETLLPGVPWLPVAFRVAEADLPRCFRRVVHADAKPSKRGREADGAGGSKRRRA